MTILDEIIATKKSEVEASKALRSLQYYKAIAEEMDEARPFYQELKSKSPKAIIAECKKRSPSKGVLVDNYDPVAIAASYERSGAAAISVLTDQQYFGGKLEHLREVSHAVDCPVLRKDFIVDEYQIHEARAHGADSFLLLASVLDYAEIQYFVEIGREYGMEALVETHSDDEIKAVLKTDAKIIGINNRDLKTMSVNLDTGAELASSVKSSGRTDVILVCESGINSPESINYMCDKGFEAFLIGEYLVKQENIEQAFLELLAKE